MDTISFARAGARVTAVDLSDESLAEIRKYMGSDSVLKMMVYHRRSWKVLWILVKFGRLAFWKLDELLARHSEAQTGCPVTYSYSRRTVRDLLQGFTVRRTMIDHIFSYRIPEYKRHEYKRVWYFAMLPQSLFRWLEKRFGWHLCVEATPNA